MGPFGSFPAPFTSDYDEPVEGWYKLLLGHVHTLSGDPAARKPVLAIVNPYAGIKRAEAVWENDCAPMLQAAGLKYQTLVTNAPGDAYEAAKSVDVKMYSAIVTVGGDGIFNEVINGMMARDDWENAAASIALASIPAGTGNGAAHTMYGTMDPHCAACHVVKAATHKADIYLAAQPSIGQYIWGILGCSYGIIAEADFGSEKIRWAGSMRPSIWAFYRILCGSAYNCRLTYLQTETPRQEWHGVRCTRDCKLCKDALKAMTDDYVDSEIANLDDEDNEDNNDDENSVINSNDNDNISNDNNDSENDNINDNNSNKEDGTSHNDEDEEIQFGDDNEEESNITDSSSSGNNNNNIHNVITQDGKFILGSNIKYHTLEPELSTVPSYGPAYTSSLTACRDWAGDVPLKYAKLFSSYPHNVVSTYPNKASTTQESTAASSSSSSSTTTTTATVVTTAATTSAAVEDGSSDASQKSLPKGWSELENRSLSFCSFQKLPWLMPGMFVAPYAHFLDGCMDISYALSESFSRITFMKLFSLFPDGSYLNNPKLSYMKVKAFTLEPLDNDGYIGVDGERIRYAPLHFHIVRALLNLLTYN